MKKFSLYIYHILILVALLFAFSKKDNSGNKNQDSRKPQVESTLNPKPEREKKGEVLLEKNESDPEERKN